MFSELPLDLQLKKPTLTKYLFETALSGFPLLFLNQTMMGKKKAFKMLSQTDDEGQFSRKGQHL